MRHEWADGSREFLLETDGSLYEIESGGNSPQTGSVPVFVAEEMIRLAKRVQVLEADLVVKVQDLDGVISGPMSWPDLLAKLKLFVHEQYSAMEGEFAAERERTRQLAMAGTEWLEPSDFVPPRPSSREGDLWRRAQAVARRELAEELREKDQ